MYTIKGNCFRISVRNLVEFMCAEGDIDNRNTGSNDVAIMQEGARIHRKIQHSMGAMYHAEVPLKIELPMISGNGTEYTVLLEGRADGIIADIIQNEDGDKIPTGNVTIDEIKTMQADVSLLQEPVYVHKAQALVYGYIYARQKNLPGIGIQMTYVTPEPETVKRFSEEYTFEQIEEWFNNLINGFKKWTDYTFDERIKRTESVKGLAFPYEYREGQKSLCVSVYRAIEEESNLYIQAPTGVGKTLSTVFPSVQALGQQMVDKIFYLTSKTITRTVAEDTYEILRKNGLHMHTVTLTAKDKICPLTERNCNPVACPYAKGHFDRVNDAVYDIITNEMMINRENITEYSERHKVCPFEMSLDVSYWCDGIICDYNYVFDPDASLKRYFGSGSPGDYVFLVDEAHNLVDRAREMYSAVLKKEDFLAVKKLVKDYDKRLSGALDKCNRLLLDYKRQCDKVKVVGGLGTFPAALERVYGLMQKFMDRHKNQPVVEDIINFFFDVRHFLNMYDCADDKYVYYTEHDDNEDFLVHLFCVDPSGNIGERLSQGRSTVFFSATLLPVSYFKEMLSGNVDDRAVYAHSSFEPDNKRVVVATDVTSRYSRRGVREYAKICDYIEQMAAGRQGCYMVFFPSYSFMESVLEMFTEKHANAFVCGDEDEEPFELKRGINVLVQGRYMKEQDKEMFLEKFNDNLPENASLVGFCVLGGIFSEGIDLKDERLIGAVIVGTGIPMICRERNILRDYFDECGKDGYSYAYVIPGMNKVLQAAGRVIRTDTDRGVIVLLDDRFLTREYELMFPREWNKVFPVTLSNAGKCISDFWKNED